MISLVNHFTFHYWVLTVMLSRKILHRETNEKNWTLTEHLGKRLLLNSPVMHLL